MQKTDISNVWENVLNVSNWFLQTLSLIQQTFSLHNNCCCVSCSLWVDVHSNMSTSYFGENSKQHFCGLGLDALCRSILFNIHKCGTIYDFMTLTSFSIRSPCTVPWHTADCQQFSSSVLHINLREKKEKEDVKIGGRVKQADGGSNASLFSPCQAFELHSADLLNILYIQVFSGVHWDNKHRHRNPAKLLFPLFLDWTFPLTLSASFTVWVFILFIEEGFALAQKTKGTVRLMHSLHSTDRWTTLNQDTLYVD